MWTLHLTRCIGNTTRHHSKAAGAPFNGVLVLVMCCVPACATLQRQQGEVCPEWTRAASLILTNDLTSPWAYSIDTVARTTKDGSPDSALTRTARKSIQCLRQRVPTFSAEEKAKYTFEIALTALVAASDTVQPTFVFRGGRVWEVKLWKTGADSWCTRAKRVQESPHFIGDPEESVKENCYTELSTIPKKHE
jgi:hypothetical protein